MFKRLIVILPLMFALLSFKVSASVLVLTGNFSAPVIHQAETKGHQFQIWIESEASDTFEEFIEEEDETESDTLNNFYFFLFSESSLSSSPTEAEPFVRQQRKLFILYKSYKIDCCKF